MNGLLVLEGASAVGVGRVVTNNPEPFTKAEWVMISSFYHTLMENWGRLMQSEEGVAKLRQYQFGRAKRMMLNIRDDPRIYVNESAARQETADILEGIHEVIDSIKRRQEELNASTEGG